MKFPSWRTKLDTSPSSLWIRSLNFLLKCHQLPSLTWLLFSTNTPLLWWGRGNLGSPTWQRTWYTKNTSLNAYFKWTDYSLTGQQSWTASSSPLYHFSLLNSSTFSVNEEEWFILCSLSSHSSGWTSSQFKVLIPGYVLETSSHDNGATLECAQAVVRHLSLLTEWFGRAVSLTVYACLQVSIYRESHCNKFHCGGDYWPFL